MNTSSLLNIIFISTTTAFTKVAQSTCAPDDCYTALLSDGASATSFCSSFLGTATVTSLTTVTSLATAFETLVASSVEIDTTEDYETIFSTLFDEVPTTSEVPIPVTITEVVTKLFTLVVESAESSSTIPDDPFPPITFPDIPVPTFDIPIPTFDIPIPTFDIPIPTFDIPIPTFDFPSFSIPNIVIPTFSFPDIEIPNFSINIPYAKRDAETTLLKKRRVCAPKTTSLADSSSASVTSTSSIEPVPLSTSSAGSSSSISTTASTSSTSALMSSSTFSVSSTLMTTLSSMQASSSNSGQSLAMSTTTNATFTASSSSQSDSVSVVTTSLTSPLSSQSSTFLSTPANDPLTSSSFPSNTSFVLIPTKISALPNPTDVCTASSQVESVCSCLGIMQAQTTVLQTSIFESTVTEFSTITEYFTTEDVITSDVPEVTTLFSTDLIIDYSAVTIIDEITVTETTTISAAAASSTTFILRIAPLVDSDPGNYFTVDLATSNAEVTYLTYTTNLAEAQKFQISPYGDLYINEGGSAALRPNEMAGTFTLVLTNPGYAIINGYGSDSFALSGEGPYFVGSSGTLISQAESEFCQCGSDVNICGTGSDNQCGYTYTVNYMFV